MEQTIYLVTLVGTALVLAAAFSSLIAFRFGAPLLLLFLGIGLAAGVDGLGIEFDNARRRLFRRLRWRWPSSCSIPASARRSRRCGRPPLPALSLATVGVVLTTGLFGAAAFYLTDFTWLESFLLGAAVASTDAAAVFFLLRAGNVNLRDRVRSTLEIESGTNDPIAIFLTITLVEVIAARRTIPTPRCWSLDLVLGFIAQYGHRRHRRRCSAAWPSRGSSTGCNLDHGLLPIFVLTLSLLVFAARRRHRRLGLPRGLSRRPRRRQFRHPRRRAS